MNGKTFRKSISLLIVCAYCLAACAKSSPSGNESSLDAQMNIRSVESLMPEQVRTIFRRSCESCHGFDGHGIAGIAPDLRRASPRSRDDWERYLRDSRASHPVSQAPPLWLTADEMKVMAEYLADQAQQN